MKLSLAVLLCVFCAATAAAVDPGTNYFPPPCTGAIFNDVACPSQYADWIEEIYNEGILVGCGGGSYCPTAPLTREQAAVALLRAEHRRKILAGVGSCIQAMAGTSPFKICAAPSRTPRSRKA